MRPDISEFSYGFALTSEMIANLGLKPFGAPLFPTQRAEGRSGGGYDVQLPGLPVFLQFKASDCLTTRNGKDAAQLGLPYYRFEFRPLKHSRQHPLLLALETRGAVFYAAPCFHRPDELSRHYVMGSVVANSVLVAPSTIGQMPDDNEHTLSFDQGGRFAVLRSEPSDPVEAFPILSAVDALNRELEKPRPGFTALTGSQTPGEWTSVLVQLFTEVTGTRPRSLLDATDVDNDAFEQFRATAMTLFDCDVLIRPG